MCGGWGNLRNSKYTAICGLWQAWGFLSLAKCIDVLQVIGDLNSELRIYDMQ